MMRSYLANSQVVKNMLNGCKQTILYNSPYKNVFNNAFLNYIFINLTDTFHDLIFIKALTPKNRY